MYSWKRVSLAMLIGSQGKGVLEGLVQLEVGLGKENGL